MSASLRSTDAHGDPKVGDCRWLGDATGAHGVAEPAASPINHDTARRRVLARRDIGRDTAQPAAPSMNAGSAWGESA